LFFGTQFFVIPLDTDTYAHPNLILVIGLYPQALIVEFLLSSRLNQAQRFTLVYSLNNFQRSYECDFVEYEQAHPTKLDTPIHGVSSVVLRINNQLSSNQPTTSKRANYQLLYTLIFNYTTL
jgi:hypothetical protein